MMPIKCQFRTVFKSAFDSGSGPIDDYSEWRDFETEYKCKLVFPSYNLTLAAQVAKIISDDLYNTSGIRVYLHLVESNNCFYLTDDKGYKYQNWQFRFIYDYEVNAEKVVNSVMTFAERMRERNSKIEVDKNSPWHVGALQ